jgi:hypothetical protein
MEEIRIYGIGFIPATEKGSHMLTGNEMTNKLAQSSVGLPVFIEHDLTMQIGEVQSATIDSETKNLMVELRVFRNPDIICHLADALSMSDHTMRRRFSGISVGTTVTLKRIGLGMPDKYGKFQEYYSTAEGSVFTEFSIVEKPDSPGCVILDWKFSI